MLWPQFRLDSLPAGGEHGQYGSLTNVSGSIHQNDPTGLTLLGLDESERLSSLNTGERRLAAAEDDWVNDQPELIYEVLAQKCRYERRATNDVDGAARLLFQGAEIADIRQKAGVLPISLLEGGGHDVMGRSLRPPCILNFVIRWRTAQHRGPALRIRRHGPQSCS